MKIKILFTFLAIILAYTLGFCQGQATGYYLGVGTSADVNSPGISCASCHTAQGIGTPKYDTWKSTRHAIATDSTYGTGFFKSTSFGYNCLSCHTSGWNTSAITFGADEYVVKDSTLKPNYRPTDIKNWDRTKNVGCEACHGNLGKYDPNALSDGTQPDTLWTDYSKHFAFTSTNKLDYSAELCGTCHNGSHHGFYEEWAVSKHAQSLTCANGLVTQVASCAKCHVAQNAAAYINGTFFTFSDGSDEGKPYYDKIIVASNSPDIQPVTCVVCHDPHDARNGIQQLRVPITAQQVVCDYCHNNSTLPDTVNVFTTPHQSTSGCLTGAPNFGYRYSSAQLKSVGLDTLWLNSAHTYACTQRCINCHLNAEGKDQFGNAAHGHTFEPRVTACNDCHIDYYSEVDTSNTPKQFDLHREQTITDSLMTVLQNKLNQSSHSDSASLAFNRANYNLQAVISDGSHGIHNTKLVQKLLTASILLYTPSGVTGLQNDPNTLPKSYSLSQNFPNPFNPTTQIRFTIPDAGNVKLTVYDAIGREVGVIVNDNLAAGTYNYTWNAGSFASGIYFYRIEAKNFVMVKKMVLIK
jgi:Secretion system C-terminal sorting domain/Cytochrome c554 and c-prime